jgi:hypothetical protein
VHHRLVPDGAGGADPRFTQVGITLVVAVVPRVFRRLRCGMRMIDGAVSGSCFETPRGEGLASINVDARLASFIGRASLLTIYPLTPQEVLPRRW